MKITKRNFVNPVTTVNIWFIPTFAYVLQKVLGIINPDKEWYWYVGISFAVLLWLVVNFKIVKNK